MCKYNIGDLVKFNDGNKYGKILRIGNIQPYRLGNNACLLVDNLSSAIDSNISEDLLDKFFIKIKGAK